MDTNTTTFGGMGTWLIILILFLFMNNGNGFGGFGGGNNMMGWLLGNQNSNNNHDNTVDLISNNTMRQNQLFANQNQANQTNMISTGFCGVNQSIERAMLQSQYNTNEIMQNCTANTQKVLDKLCEQETDRLRTALSEARVIANNTKQTADIINAIRPFPQASYIVSSPYTSIYPPETTTAGA